jgi:hypothetical protein
VDDTALLNGSILDKLVSAITLVGGDGPNG